MTYHQDSSSHPRLVRKLKSALGDIICAALDDPQVIEVMANPDGQLFIERSGGGIVVAGDLNRTAAETVIGIVAHALNAEVDDTRPIISGELPPDGHRFEGLLPPIVEAPCFSIRRQSVRVFKFDDYVHGQSMTRQQAEILRDAIAGRLNILIAGGTGSGKTTLANALLAEIAAQSPLDRLVILEDTIELRCAIKNVVSLRTSDDVDMARLLKSTMRLRPDRIVIGEVRDGAALTMLKAWNTGHPGGLATIHSNTARSALLRLEQLVAEVSEQPMRDIIADAVDIVTAIERTSGMPRITEILRVHGLSGGHYEAEPASGGYSNVG